MIRSSCSVLVALSISIYTFSQKSDLAKKESKPTTIIPKFGFNLGADYSLVQNHSSQDTLAINPSTIYNAPGFRLGVFGDIKIQKRLTIMPKAEISFNSTKAELNGKRKKLDPINLDFMLHGKLNFTKRENKFNPYCSFGPSLRIPLITNTKENYSTTLGLSGDICIGLDIDLNIFYLSPEIRYNHGITNIKNKVLGEKIRWSYLAFNLLFTGK